MFSNTAEYYDRIYAQFKDYNGEAEKIRAIIQKENPEAETILDVACGTGKHARILHEKFGYKITGVDLDENFVRLAQKNFPEGKFYQADMRDFSLDEQFDVVMCLFSSIGYVKETEDVIKTLQCFKRHLKKDGILIVEPWLTPEKFTAGRFSLNTVDDEDLKIARMTYGEKFEHISRFTFEYLIADKEGIRRETEIHELALFSIEEMMSFFEESGLKTEYDPVGLFDRGLYLTKPV
jgi:ubiquinone/menaquinone biosynthesis C-methylase UbiE